MRCSLDNASDFCFVVICLCRGRGKHSYIHWGGGGVLCVLLTLSYYTVCLVCASHICNQRHYISLLVGAFTFFYVPSPHRT